MEETLLDDFKEFLEEYRTSWNSVNPERMSAHQSKDLEVRWANPEAIVSDWGDEEAKQGWNEAYKQYQGRNPEWLFEDVLIEINKQKEGVAVFWVGFKVDGKMTNAKLLFIETFRKENSKWKKIREYVENSFAS
ncbi:pyridine nucleotide-disulfide oxidoreductase [Oceanobacillus picturae]|jgi:hypothetical protein|uniref:Pyridine nucleotide-disulfide oxidoreductase n=1 Tax=Oceanobacillus picturae TaxID=171693 RepID=W9AMJ8_9BACI|nr:hypothetical protein [Oceanobacillus picturae]GAQ17753.1 pyridine nucleotide-disulfide oxidoreductase [Oceanobacillus picturae]CDO03886.1 hypothetical protein BN988_02419 [Oceanobacillus picturae]